MGAHAQHLDPSAWHRTGQCTDCHAVPASMDHTNGVTDFSWSGPSAADGAAPAYTAATVTCSGTYCHGTTLAGPNAAGTVDREPQWTTVDGTHDACGSTCHTNPPGGSHPQSTACETCPGAVIASYNPADPAATTWADASRHVDGVVDVSGLTCTSCHGNAQTGDAQPPLGTQGNPVTARGTCVGACHSNGNGGAPVRTPYWAGGTWVAGGLRQLPRGNPGDRGAQQARQRGKHGVHGLSPDRDVHAAHERHEELHGRRHELHRRGHELHPGWAELRSLLPRSRVLVG